MPIENPFSEAFSDELHRVIGLKQDAAVLACFIDSQTRQALHNLIDRSVEAVFGDQVREAVRKAVTHDMVSDAIREAVANVVYECVHLPE